MKKAGIVEQNEEAADMQKEKFITVMALLDDKTQELLQSIQKELEEQYGADTKTPDIPYHLTLGSYAAV